MQPFTLQSEPIEFDNNGRAVVEFPRKATCPSAIIGIGTGHEALHPYWLYGLLLRSIRVASREHAQGDPFPLGLVSAYAPPCLDIFPGLGLDLETLGAAGYPPSIALEPDGGGGYELHENLSDEVIPGIIRGLNAVAYPCAKAPYWPGSLLQLRDGRRVGGILMEPHDTVSLTIEEFLADSSHPIEKLVLHCVAFPEKGAPGRRAAPTLARFRRGEGELTFVGNSHTYEARFDRTFTQKPNPHHTPYCRRLRVRGLTEEADNGMPTESEFRLLRALLSTQSQRAPQDEAVGARQVIGHPGLDWIDGEVDLHPDEEANVRIIAPEPTEHTLTGNSEYRLRLCSIFEGRNPDDEFIETAKAI